ncbi:hypothetical protein BU24DRAFT_427146 [Aaosphaeria arxii CBS 175.79]|uniref:Uncharacterized protein n=1 Tax=Aaosphaeria arxii CBS 175.79 TaxID=1450172 RepID=A0A6A5XDF7_9PLEO|nr:uncharacterized protein BU24DRAFT_427146 [Aaosphaeria arxii CBS 175.79]KAF2010949.1 hypothetical protein BU24DRAFT_427146 [Aaosphaeria arxii CBS 175.79]
MPKEMNSHALTSRREIRITPPKRDVGRKVIFNIVVVFLELGMPLGINVLYNVVVL